MATSSRPKRTFIVTENAGNKQWYWHAEAAANRKTTFQGEGHPSSTNAVRAIKQELKALGATSRVAFVVRSANGMEKSSVYDCATGQPVSAIPARLVPPADSKVSAKRISAQQAATSLATAAAAALKPKR